jgi:hypothetical protein
MRAEHLNATWFYNLVDARFKIRAWRDEYKSERPHNRLGGRTPNEKRGTSGRGRAHSSLSPRPLQFVRAKATFSPSHVNARSVQDARVVTKVLANELLRVIDFMRDLYKHEYAPIGLTLFAKIAFVLRIPECMCKAC